jgi:hypothetical protein
MSEFVYEMSHFFNLSQTLPWRRRRPYSLDDGLLHRFDFVGHEQS